MIKVIHNFPDYSVSDEGDVFSLYYQNRFGKYIRSTPYKLKVNYSKTGYGTVALGSQLNGEMKRVLVHRLVSTAFLDNPNNFPQVNHKNGIKSDNRSTNLEWCTASQNNKHAFAIGLKSIKGDLHPNKKISQKIADHIKSIGNSKSQREVAVKYGIHQSLVSRILRNEAW